MMKIPILEKRKWAELISARASDPQSEKPSLASALDRRKREIVTLAKSQNEIGIRRVN